MKEKPSIEISFKKFIEKNNSFIDLTKPLDNSLEIYSSDDYSDPELEIKTWCSYMERGFHVSRILMGTQTGTHIDAPAHFVDGGAQMDSLMTGDLMGRYYLINVSDAISYKKISEEYTGEPFIFLKGHAGVIELPEELYNRLLELDAKIWVSAGECTVHGKEKFYFNRGIALKGKFLVEDLDPEKALSITKAGCIFALPLRLMRTSGAPCRVIAVEDQ